MRFEYYIGLIHLVIWTLYALKNRLGLIEWLIVLLVTMYGPLYALVKLKLLNLSLVASLLLVFISSFKVKQIPKFYFLIVPLLLFQIFLAINNEISLTALLKGILSLILALSGLLLGRWIAHSNLERWFILLTVSTSIVAVSTVLLRFLQTETLRDAGISFFIIPLLIYCIFEKRYLYLLALLVYLFAIQTRSLLILLVFVLFIGRNVLFQRYGKISVVSIIILLFSVSGLIIYQRSTEGGSQGGELASITTRLNAIIREFADFSSSPFIGNGIFYYQEEWTELLNDQINGKSGLKEYIAYNHVGVLSTAAQTGIYGLYILVYLPYRLYRRASTNMQDKFLFIFRLGLLSFIISFLFSGSPLRTDFLDMFYYYFLLSLVYELNLRKNLIHL